jgi:hypothetical protein
MTVLFAALHESAFGPKADISICTAHVRFWGKSRLQVLHCKCGLMTQSGHRGWLVKSV